MRAEIEEWKRRYETARMAHEEGRAEIDRLRNAMGDELLLEETKLMRAALRKQSDEIERLRPIEREARDELNRINSENERLEALIALHERHVTEDAATIANLQVTLEACQAVLRDAMSELTEARDEIERLTVALEIIAGRRQCIDNLMSNVDVACAALDGGKP